ncbi:2OG-Fe(II) oxygenase [filamentous cyanobacterium LEGE 11480]|uniref:2OG-Fe(II) oxygenase n=1 Tax=Romeriopsis navalis LEGE 11480 TaxID=2777977 RepID=A0A928VPP0_9CYAN|nr:2OG-Fe(II) oxygenase [Romeriopsis navalis]MBE9032488.1 2OG-Fe(II) oxygenase [Romeriopsis navalis LEGE 11480]
MAMTPKQLDTPDIPSSQLNPPTAPHPVRVQILLAGGHQHTLSLSSDAPLLHQLFTVLVNQTQADTVPSLLQIPLQSDTSNQAIAFSSDKLVGIVTDPPVFAQRQPVETPTGLTQFAAPKAATAAVSPPAPKAYRYIQIEDFLPPELHQQLLNYATTSRADYVETGPATNTEFYKDHRNSLVIYYPRYTEMLIERLHKVMPRVIQHLDLAEFEVARIETQLTAHNDGNYYKMHNDNGSEETASRQLTYVYYFYQEPQAFSGGNLAIYDTERRDGRAYGGQNHQIVQPLNNSIVFFPSFYMHEVQPVICPSQAFEDSRFTLNGWIRQPEKA